MRVAINCWYVPKWNVLCFRFLLWLLMGDNLSSSPAYRFLCRRFYDIIEPISLVVCLWTGCYSWLESYVKLKLKSSLHKFYGRPHELVNLCMLNFLVENNSWHVSCLTLWIVFSSAGFNNDFATVPLLGNAHHLVSLTISMHNIWSHSQLSAGDRVVHVLLFPDIVSLL